MIVWKRQTDAVFRQQEVRTVALIQFCVQTFTDRDRGEKSWSGPESVLQVYRLRSDGFCV